MELLRFLNSVHPLSEALLDHLRTILKPRELSRKEYLLKAGHICRHICFIEQGLLRCFYMKEDHEVCSWFMKEGDVIISVESFYTQKPSYESIQALEDCILYYIEYNELQQIYRRFPEFNFTGRVLTENYYALSEQRLYSMRMQRSQERYDYLMEHHSELVLRVPAKYLASYLGITEVTMSKIKSRF
ncbi:MAG: Crp/Fnr family transcriptional regulator [Flaviaesturariibacter sp.]|nr:Crp/Fnr family transcriptional regulator [Flaviaesturariibacter sp.]